MIRQNGHGPLIVDTAIDHSQKALLLGFASAAVFILSYWRVIAALVAEWSVNTQYSYGFLVPLISVYLAWTRRDRLARLHARPSLWGGGALFFAGLCLAILGERGAIMALQQVSFVLSLAGLVLLLLGRRFLRALWFPIAYLLISVPVWDLLTEPAHMPFQLFSARIGRFLLLPFGVPAHLDGIYIVLPSITLKVERICSGVNFLIAVVALGIPLAYLYFQGWFKRIALIATAVVIAILSNGLRVTLVALLAHYRIGNATHGPFHIFQGLFVSVVGFAVLLAGVWFTADRSPVSSGRRTRGIHAAWELPSSSAQRGSKAAPLVAILLMSVAFLLHLNLPASAVPLAGELSGFPLDVGGWSAATSAVRPQELEELGATQTLARDYLSPEGGRVELQIAYFDAQTNGRELVGFRTRELHYGARKETRAIAGYGDVPVNRVLQRSEKGERTVLFWYDIGGRPVAGRLKAKALTTAKAIATGSTNGALVLLSVDHDRRTPAPDALESFLASAYPLIRHSLR